MRGGVTVDDADYTPRVACGEQAEFDHRAERALAVRVRWAELNDGSVDREAIVKQACKLAIAEWQATKVVRPCPHHLRMSKKRGDTCSVRHQCGVDAIDTWHKTGNEVNAVR